MKVKNTVVAIAVFSAFSFAASAQSAQGKGKKTSSPENEVAQPMEVQQAVEAATPPPKVEVRQVEPAPVAEPAPVVQPTVVGNPANAEEQIQTVPNSEVKKNKAGKAGTKSGEIFNKKK